MKRIFITLVAAWACVFNVNAQLVVDSLGRVGIGTETPSEMLSIRGRKASWATMTITHDGDKRGLYIRSRQFKDNSASTMKGIDVMAMAAENMKYIGVFSNVRNMSHSSHSYTSVGISGSAVDSKNNIGILGTVAPSDTVSFSVGVYGRVGSAGSLPPKANTVGSYAGYFYGPVKVVGRIYGTLYSPTSTASSSLANPAKRLSSLSEDEETISDKLLSVQTIQFMREEETGRLKPSASSDKLTGKTAIDDNWLSEDKNTEELMDEETCMEEESPLETEMVKRYGLDGAQLKAVFPELVDEDSQGNYRINYSEMVPLLLQSIRELSARVEELEGEKSSLAKKAKATSIESESESTDIVRMSQNKPNPFSESSVITLSIPEGTKSAAIYVYDLSGKQVKNIPVDKCGETDITVYASDLSEGMFVYSLVTDGTVAATRRMMVVKN